MPKHVATRMARQGRAWQGMAGQEDSARPASFLRLPVLSTAASAVMRASLTKYTSRFSGGLPRWSTSASILMLTHWGASPLSSTLKRQCSLKHCSSEVHSNVFGCCCQRCAHTSEPEPEPALTPPRPAAGRRQQMGSSGRSAPSHTWSRPMAESCSMGITVLNQQHSGRITGGGAPSRGKCRNS